MTICNTVNNFYAQNTNFGQALLYGALGSLTGGMGCFGGGYGMGMMSPFSMGGSLFSMIGMGGFGMGCIPNSMIGIKAGYSAVNILIAGAGQAIEGRGSKAAEKKQAIEDANSSVSTLTSDLKTLSSDVDKLEHGFDEKTGTVSSDLKSLLPTQTKEYTDAQDALAKFATNNDEYGLKIKAQNKAKEELNKKYPTDADKEKEEYKSAIAEINKRISEYTGQQLAKKAEAEEQLDKKTTALKEAINTEKTKKEKEIENKTAELKKAREALDKAGADDVKVSKKCDSEKEYKEITKKPIDEKNVKKYVKAFNYKFSQYCKASSSVDKKAIAIEAIATYKKINDNYSNEVSSDMTRNMRIMESYVNNNGKKFEM